MRDRLLVLLAGVDRTCPAPTFVPLVMEGDSESESSMMEELIILSLLQSDYLIPDTLSTCMILSGLDNGQCAP